MDLMSMLGGGMPPGPGMGAPGMGMPPMMGGNGMTKPGQGMNAMSAMMGGLGMQPPGGGMGGPPGAGHNGLPFGGIDPGPGSPEEMGGSDLLSMLSGGGDPYDQPAGQTPLSNVGQPPDDQMQQLMQMLALAQMGVNPGDAQGDPMGMGGGMGCGPMGGGMC